MRQVRAQGSIEVGILSLCSVTCTGKIYFLESKYLGQENWGEILLARTPVHISESFCCPGLDSKLYLNIL